MRMTLSRRLLVSVRPRMQAAIRENSALLQQYIQLASYATLFHVHLCGIITQRSRIRSAKSFAPTLHNRYKIAIHSLRVSKRASAPPPSLAQSSSSFLKRSAKLSELQTWSRKPPRHQIITVSPSETHHLPRHVTPSYER